MKPNSVSLVVGADGLIGRALADQLRAGGQTVVETTRRPGTISGRRVFLDLSIDVSGWRPPYPIEEAYLCAGISSLEGCRRHPAESAIVNVDNTIALARSVAASGTPVVFLSTNLVYDGAVPFRKADDPVCPQTEYGRQKAAAERQLLSLGRYVAVVRLTKVLGPNVSLFKDWIRALGHREPIYPFSDMVMAPVPLSLVVDVMQRIATRKLPGIVQISGEKDVTYEEVARYVASRVGASPGLVQPARARETNPLLEAFPAHTTLDMGRLVAELGVGPPHVWSVIDSAIGQHREFVSTPESG